MRPITRLTATTTALALAAAMSIAADLSDGCYVALAGDPATTDDDVIACEEQHWFHRATTHASNVGYVAAPHGTATFDTTPPTGSVTAGNGGGYVGWSTILVGGDDGLIDASFTGTFTGTLDRLDVDLHLLVDSLLTVGSLPLISIGDGYPLDLELLVDDIPIFSVEEARLAAAPETSSNAGAYRLDFAIDNLAEFFDQFDLPNDADTVHTVQLIAGSAFVDQVFVMSFDTTEVPGGIFFNRVDIPDGTAILNG